MRIPLLHVCASLIVIFISLVTLAAEPSLDTAQDIYELPKVVALQNRAYYLNKELDLHLGYLPLDAFTKSVVYGAGYTYYLSDFIGWEVVNYNGAYKIDTGLKNELINRFGATVQGILDYVNWYATTNIIYTPLYTKNLLFNKTLVHGETSFVFGGGAVQYQVAGLMPLVSGGLILRYFTSESQSLKFDIRSHVRFGSSGSDVILALIVGYAWQLGEPPKRGDVENEKN